VTHHTEIFNNFNSGEPFVLILVYLLFLRIIWESVNDMCIFVQTSMQ